MKISRPRLITASAAARRDRPRLTPAAAASGIDRPASHRNSGAAKPASITAYAYGVEPREAVRVHASVVCASIIRSTAMPRVQSMYAARRRSGAGVDVTRHAKIDVGIERMPHGTVLLAGQRD